MQLSARRHQPAIAGDGSTPQFVAEMLRDAGMNITIIPYKSGSEAMTAVLLFRQWPDCARPRERGTTASFVAFTNAERERLRTLAQKANMQADKWPQRSRTAGESGSYFVHGGESFACRR